VSNESLPQLEGVKLKACIDTRHFDVGVPAIVNLERAKNFSHVVEGRIATGKPHYWDYSKRLELAVLAKVQHTTESGLGDALAGVRVKWEPETTARNLRLIREARARRNEPDGRALIEIEQSLADKTK